MTECDLHLYSHYRRRSPNWTANDPKTENDPQIVPQTESPERKWYEMREMSGLLIRITNYHVMKLEHAYIIFVLPFSTINIS